VKDEIIDVWSQRSQSYSKVVQGGMASTYESRGWQEIFTEAMGPGKHKVLDVGTGPGVVALDRKSVV
jgi:ubiquinone/menaquinone biosynthesis C-methylase UbiE